MYLQINMTHGTQKFHSLQIGQIKLFSCVKLGTLSLQFLQVCQLACKIILHNAHIAFNFSDSS